jgi:hypothetical protein
MRTVSKPTDRRALRTIRIDYPETEAVMLYRGHQRLRLDGIWCPPAEEFLSEMVPNRHLLASFT